MNNKRNWEQMGAGSGLLAAALFVAAFIVFTSTSPTGSPPLPSIQNAEQAPAFLAAHLSTVRIELLLLTLGIVLFLWFVGSLWSSLREAEGDPALGAMLAVVGASVGAALMLVGVVLSFASGLSTSPAQAQGVPTLYTASALLFAFGGGALSIFFFAVGKVIVGTAVMGRWLGWLALLGGVLAASPS